MEGEPVVPRAPLAACDLCPLYGPPRARMDSCVQGHGARTADIVLVGEAPGATELVLRKPFVGDSGILLNKTLAQVGVARSEVYVTNAALCRPQAGNVPPPITAVRACQARLFEEIRTRRPRVVIAMGNSALKSFGVDERITACRGRERWLSVHDLLAALHRGRRKRDLARYTLDEDWRDGGFYLLPTFHPAYALRNQDAYPDIVKDIRRAVELVGHPPAVQRVLPEMYTVVPTSVYDALRWLRIVGQQELIACDIESRSKDMLFDEGSLLTLAYAWRDGERISALVLPAALAKNPLVRMALRTLHQQPRPRQGWWYGKFDMKWYKVHLSVDVRIDADGLLAHYALDERRGIHGLKQRASDDLGAPDYEAEIRRFTGRGKDVDYGRIPFDKLVEYTAQDVGMTLMLIEKYEAALSAEPRVRWAYDHILRPASHVLADMEMRGVLVDAGVLQALDHEYTSRDGDMENWGLLPTYRRQMHEAAGIEFNVASFPQVAQVMYGSDIREKYGIRGHTANGLPTLRLPLATGRNRRPSTSADACEWLLRRDDLIAVQRQFLTALRRHREDDQLYKVYIKKLPLALGHDGRVRTNFNLHTTRSGRLSSSDPTNLQNIPIRRLEGQRIRRAFVAPPGWSLVEVDVNQAELRTAAFLSRDEGLLQIYRDGRDFHHEVGVRILGDEARARELRPYVKTVNFAALYSATPKMLTILLNDTALEEATRTGEPARLWTLDEAERLYTEFWAQFPGYARWAAWQRELAEQRGWVESHFGRRRRWALITRENRYDVHKEAPNDPVQSTASDIVMLGVIELHRRLRGSSDAHLLIVVHDSVVLEVAAGMEPIIARMAVEVLESTPARYGIDVPFIADAKSGPNWWDMERVQL